MTSLIAFDMHSSMEKIQELRDILTARLDSKATTQIALAKATGIDQASINRFYKKGEGLSAENFIKLAEWVGAKIIWPSEKALVNVSLEQEVTRLHDRAESLARENTLLNKLLAEYEEKLTRLESESRALEK